MRSSARLFSLAALAALSSSACGSRDEAKETAVASAPIAVLPPFQQEIASLKAEVTLPGSWRSGYRMVDKPDTLYGAHRAIEFHYTADSIRGVPPRLLMVIREFKKPVWEKVKTEQLKSSRLLTEHNGEVYAFSVVTQSPYPTGSVSTLRVDQMMVALMAETSPFKLTFK